MSEGDSKVELEPAIAERLVPFATTQVRGDETVAPDTGVTRVARRIAAEIEAFSGAGRATSVEIDWLGPGHRIGVRAVLPDVIPTRLSTPLLEAELARGLGVPVAIDVAPEALTPPHLAEDARASEASARTLLRLLVRARSRSEGALRSVRDEEVHQLRVGFRRFRGASRMLRRAFDAETEARFTRAMEVARSAMQRAGAVRDLDVLLDDLKWAERRAADPDESTRAMRHVLRAKRDRALVPMRRYLGSRTYAVGLVRLEQMLVTLADDGGQHEKHHRDAGAFARKRFRKEELRCLVALTTLDVAHLEQAHAIRIAAKKMRYCAELVTGIVGRADGIARAAADVQSTLGRERDAARAMEEMDAARDRGAVRATAALTAMYAALAMRRMDARASARWALAALKDALE